MTVIGLGYVSSDLTTHSPGLSAGFSAAKILENPELADGLARAADAGIDLPRGWAEVEVQNCSAGARLATERSGKLAERLMGDTMMQNTKAAALPNWLPVPPAEPTTCVVYIARKQAGQGGGDNPGCQ